MVTIFYHDKPHVEMPYVELVRLIAMTGSLIRPTYTVEVKRFDAGSTIERGIKGWIFSGGTHEV